MARFRVSYQSNAVSFKGTGEAENESTLRAAISAAVVKEQGPKRPRKAKPQQAATVK